MKMLSPLEFCLVVSIFVLICEVCNRIPVYVHYYESQVRVIDMADLVPDRCRIQKRLLQNGVTSDALTIQLVQTCIHL